MTPNRSHKNEAAARVNGRPKMARRRQEAGAGARAPPALNTDISHEWEGESRPGTKSELWTLYNIQKTLNRRFGTLVNKIFTIE